MPDAFLTRRSILMQKRETTYGTDAAPTDSASYDSIRLIEPWTADLNQDHAEVRGGNLTRGSQRPIGTVRPAGVTLRTYVTGLDSASYTTNLRPPIGDLLRACGLFETFVNSDSNGRPVYRYQPSADVSSDFSVTIVAHRDGFEHRLLGCRGNVNFVFVAANPVVAEFSMRGMLSTEASTARSAPTGLPTAVPPRWVGSGSVYVESWQCNVANANINTNNTVLEQRASTANSGPGIVAIWLTNREPGGSFDPEATEPNTLAFFANWRTSSGGVMRLQAGTTQGNRFFIIASQTVFKRVNWGDNTGLALFNTDFQCYERNSNDEFMIEFQ